MRRCNGFSLLELLICVLIIGILMSMYMGTLSKARRKAEKVAVAEGIRQKALGHMADHANIARPSKGKGQGATRHDCRQAYRQTIHTSEFDAFLTEMRYLVRNEDEFRAYWHTLIDPNASDQLEFSNDGALIARDESGDEFFLRPLGIIGGNERSGPYPVAWEFLSTDLADTTVSGLGINVLYSDGHIEYLTYPNRFPACPIVAQLSHQLMRAMEEE